MQRGLIITASLAVSAIFLFLVLRTVPLDEVWHSIQQANMLWVLLSFAVSSLGLWTRGIRWRGLLSTGRVSRRDGFFILSITSLLNQLPLRAGEVARGLLATQRDVPFMTAATSIVVERLLDTLIVVLMLLAALTQIPQLPPEATQAATLFGVGAVLGFVVLLSLAGQPRRARVALAWLLDRLPLLQPLPLARLFDQVLDGLQPLTDWRRCAHALIWTLISWGCSLLGLLLLHFALSIDDVPLALSTLLGMSLTSFSVAIPVSVMALGPFEAAMMLTGEIVGMDPITALSLGFLTHGVAILAYIVWGVMGLLAMGVSLADLRQPRPADAPVAST